MTTEDPLAYWNAKHMNELQARDYTTDIAKAEYGSAAAFANENNMSLGRVSDSHYQLWGPDGCWLINMYPGNHRIYSPKHLLAPYLFVERGNWTLTDVIRAAIEAHERNSRG